MDSLTVLLQASKLCREAAAYNMAAAVSFCGQWTEYEERNSREWQEEWMRKSFVALFVIRHRIR